MSWYKITLPFKQGGVGGMASALQSEFETAFIANCGPKDAAMFTNRAEDFETCVYYFSPAAAAIAGILIESYKGVKCSPPAMDKVSLLVGHTGALEALLSRKGSN